jgi:AraC-like DNA-binding protein
MRIAPDSWCCSGGGARGARENDHHAGPREFMKWMRPRSHLGSIQRRRVDWMCILGPEEAPVPQLAQQSPRGQLANLLSAFDEILALDDPDAILRRAVEVAHKRVGFDRAAIFLIDRDRNLMLGTWGSDLRGGIVDERHIMYEVSHTDREAIRRSDEDGAHFTVFNNCPIVEHRDGSTRVAGRGWVACTPIRSSRGPIGIMFNDSGLSGRPVDEIKQGHAAILCSLLGTILDPVRSLIVGSPAANGPSNSRLGSAAVSMLSKDPTMGGKQIAAKLDISLSRLARVFKAQLGMSLVEYRNRLRLDRFSVLMAQGHTNLLGAALAAGFGSYAQFHRVFRAVRKTSPRNYLRATREGTA